ncbi:uncharacterized protein K02A2.6-like [Lineus longissimus]|uniref:uncharacterized protein K02A2.6-like n=1 Tax=Lineus longissimus TaxID=88925 RepID=UPI00315DEC72
MEGLKPPKPLRVEGNTAENWRKWRQQFEWYRIATDLRSKGEDLQCAALLSSIGEEAVEIYTSFVFTDAEKDKYDPLVEKFEQYCTPKKNVTYERHVFNSRIQLDGETFDNFLTDLRNKSKTCEYGTLSDSLIKDRIVYGIRSNNVRERLLRERTLDLSKAIDICRAAELSKSHLENLNSSTSASANVSNSASRVHGSVHTGTSSVNKINKWSKKSAGTKSKDSKTSNFHGQGNDCGNCGRQHLPKQCPAYGKSCRGCGKKNHYERFCRSTKRSHQGKFGKSVHAVCQYDEEDDDNLQQFEQLFIGTVNSKPKSSDMHDNEAQWHVQLPIGPKRDKMLFKIDTGAQANVIPYYMFRKIRKAPALSQVRNVKLSTYDGSEIKVRGKCSLTCTHKNRDYQIEFIVANVKTEAILGAKSSVHLGLLKRIYDVRSSTNNGSETETETTIGKTNQPNRIAKSDSKSQAILDEYEDLFHGIGCLKVPDHHISLKENANPVIYPPRKMPEALKPRLKAELSKMQEQNIIKSVDEPTDWVNPIACVEKPDGSLRICLDPKELNQAIRREHYELPTADDISAKLAGAKYFSVLDASSSFWHIKLDHASSRLTTFNTCFGRFRFLRLPFGISSASEVFQKILAQILEGLEGCCNSVDDILVYADTKEHDVRLRKVLNRLREVGLKLKQAKCIVGVTEVIYVGLMLTQNGVKPNPTKVEAIIKMPHPEDKSALMRFIGMVQYFGKFIPNLSQISAPLRELLQKDTQWHWDEPQRNAIELLKQKLTEAPVLSYYDPKKELTVTADASKDGIGAALLQERHPIAFASRALTSCEQNYAQIEKETLAATFACEKFHQYVYGRDFLIESDHKPLETIVKKPLFKAPPRIQRFLLRLQKYNFKLVHVPGKQLIVADTLSRANLPGQEESDMEREVNLQVHLLISSLAVSDKKLKELQIATAQDTELQKLQETIRNGFPEHRRSLDNSLDPYWQDQDEYHVAEELVFKGNRIVVPRSLRSEMIDIIHQGHLGTEMCKRRAKELLFWPGMLTDITDKVSKCGVCQKFSHKQQKEPLKPNETPTRPWQQTASDLFYFHCKDYLVIVDAYSGFFEVEMLEDTSSETVINHIKKTFARHGIPESLFTDNGPQYTSRKFKEFADKWSFIHKTSSPRYPRANGLAERTVQTVKNLLKKAKEAGQDPYLALLTYRDTPRSNDMESPAQLLLGRRLRSQLPVLAEKLKTNQPDSQIVHEKLLQRKNVAKTMHDRHSRKMPYQPLKPGDQVRIQNEKVWTPGEIMAKADQPRSYHVQTSNGNVLRRNRSHMKKVPTGSTRTIKEQFPQTTLEDEETIRNENTNIGQSLETNSQPIVTRSGRVVKPNRRYQDYVCN